METLPNLACRSCRALQLLQTDPLVAKIGFDPAENEPSKIWVTGIPVQAPPAPVYPILRAGRVEAAKSLWTRCSGGAAGPPRLNKGIQTLYKYEI